MKDVTPALSMDKALFQQAKFFMFADIFREIELARASDQDLKAAGVTLGGGNFLAALGLLCYTEFGGKLRYDHDRAAANFSAFFDDLGPPYKAFRTQHNVYDIFRCGLAHEYYVKKNCVIAMLGTAVPAGVRQLADGRFELVVERYCLDLKNAFDVLEAELYPDVDS